jgi:hypothetical protein
MTPALVTVPAEMRPPVFTVNPTPELAIVPSDADFSAIVTLKPLAAITSSDTFARIV